MRKSTAFILFIIFNLGVSGALLLHANFSNAREEGNRRYRAQLVSELRLTDLCLFTEARYSRNLSMSDNFSAFQDHPVALEHFPSGAFTMPRHRR